MFDAGILTICRLTNSSTDGNKPHEVLQTICTAFYDKLNVGVNRAYAALSANQKIDMLVKCYNTLLPVDAEYVLIDNDQYRITLKQPNGDDIDLTLERMGEYMDVYTV